MSAVEPVDARGNLEKLDDLQAAHPLPYNLVVGALMGLVLVALGFHPGVVPIYAASYGALRAFLWADGRMLRRQYDARKVRWVEQQAARRRNRF